MLLQATRLVFLSLVFSSFSTYATNLVGTTFVESVPAVAELHAEISAKIDSSGASSEKIKEKYLNWLEGFEAASSNPLEATLELQKKLEYVRSNLIQLSKQDKFVVPSEIGLLAQTLVKESLPTPEITPTVSISSTSTVIQSSASLNVANSITTQVNKLDDPKTDKQRSLGGYPALAAAVLVFVGIFLLYFKFFEKLFMTAKDRRSAGIDRFIKKIFSGLAVASIGTFFFIAYVL
jgi:hypothetical protein